VYYCSSTVSFQTRLGSRNPTPTKEKVMYYGGLAGIAVLVFVLFLWSGRF